MEEVRIPILSTAPLPSIPEEDDRKCRLPDSCAGGCMIWNIIVFILVLIGLLVGFLKAIGVF